MITIIRAADGSIKTYSAKADYDFNFVLGESLEYLDADFTEYTRRLRLSVNDVSGETIRTAQGSADLIVNVACTTDNSVDITVNDQVETVSLVDGAGQILLSTENPGVFVLSPADRRRFCPAGEALLTVEVVANE